MSRISSWLLHGNVKRTTVMVPVTDETKLATDIYVPLDRSDPAPTIMERTPYDRRNPELLKMASQFVGRGYNVVLQDTRGRGDSEGMFQHYIARPHEGEDGNAVLDWICQQGWSDGQVGTTGFSFTGANQQALAIMRHPALRSQVIFDAGSDYFRRCVREDGAFVFAQLGVYALNMAISSPQARKDPLLRARLDAVRRSAKDWYARAPWRAGDSPVSALPEYEEWLLHAQDNPVENDTWRNPAMMLEPFIDQYPDISKLFVTSWYAHHAWSNFRKMKAFESHLSPTKLLIGTWIHTSPYGFARNSGDTDFGPDASLNMNEIRLRWFDATLRGKESDELNRVPTITYFAMGGGRGGRDSENRIEHGGKWKTAMSWPPSDGADLVLRLGATSNLSMDARSVQHRRTVSVNLDHPVPTIGSSLRNPDIMPGFISSGGVDQVERSDVLRSPGTGLPLSSRPDVAVFRSAVFKKPLEIVGPLTIRLWVSAGTTACDLSLKIVDEYPASADWPNGFALNVADHYQRFASWTEVLAGDAEQPQLIEIGPIHLANRFMPGHRLRLQVANSNWPRYDRNPEAPVRFEFSVWCGADTPSEIIGANVLQESGPFTGHLE